MDPPLCGLTFISHNGSRRPTQPCRHRRGRPGNQRCGSSASLAQSLAGRASAWPPAASALYVSAGRPGRAPGPRGLVGLAAGGRAPSWARPPPGAGAGGAMEGPAIRAPLGVDDHQGPARGRRQRGSGAAAPLAVGAQQQWGATRAPRCAPGARPALVTARRGRGAASGSVVPAGGHACRTAWAAPRAAAPAPRPPRRQALLSPRWAAGQQGEAAGVEDAEHLQALARPPPERHRLVTRPGSGPLPAPARRAAGGARGGVTPGQPWAAWCG